MNNCFKGIKLKKTFLIVCSLIILGFGVFNLVEYHFLKGILKIVIGAVLLIIYSDKDFK